MNSALKLIEVAEQKMRNQTERDVRDIILLMFDEIRRVSPNRITWRQWYDMLQQIAVEDNRPYLVFASVEDLRRQFYEAKKRKEELV